MGTILHRVDRRSRAVWYLKKFLLTPYLWGGDDFSGFDCSGLVIEVLQGVGTLPHGSDFTADQLYKRFEPSGITGQLRRGCLVFWFRNNKATHVEMLIDRKRTIGASGGGSATTTKDDAIRDNAFVKMRPIDYRGKSYKIVDPFKEGD